MTIPPLKGARGMFLKMLFSLFFILSITNLQAQSTMKKIIKTTDAPAPIGPYSQAVLIGNTLYISGQVPIDPATGNVVSGDIKAEAKQVMKNLANILKAAGMDFTNVVKTTIFLKDMNDFAAVNEIYGSFFTSDFPARETVQAARLPKDVNVEISMIAVK
jgi:2-iminobutanoate/2-iminopropanoate deaminase